MYILKRIEKNRQIVGAHSGLVVAHPDLFHLSPNAPLSRSFLQTAAGTTWLHHTMKVTITPCHH